MSIDFNDSQLLDNHLSGTVRDEAAPQTSDVVDIVLELHIFDPEQITSDQDIIAYWSSHENHHLYELARCLYAIPPTEVEIERDFSLLNFIFTQRRHRLTEKHLEAILRIHLNKDIFHLIKREELSKLEEV